MVCSIGADHAIDYTKEDFTKPGQPYDLIIDNAANRSISEYKRALTPQGICVVVGYSPGLMLQLMVLGRWISKSGGQKMGLMLADTNKKDLEILKELLEEEKVVPVIDRRYPLSSAAEAIRYLEKGHARGKVVITIAENNQA